MASADGTFVARGAVGAGLHVAITALGFSGQSFEGVVINAGGSFNLTGAGIGAKGPHRRNFEAGFITTDPALVGQIMEQFDAIWQHMGTLTPKPGDEGVGLACTYDAWNRIVKIESNPHHPLDGCDAEYMLFAIKERGLKVARPDPPGLC